MDTETGTFGKYQQNRRFHGVYLLYCLNEAHKGRTYIGYTVDPQRRIKQHNLGKAAGGAWKTSGKGPWDMVLIVHGFPNDVAGLRFEWAWQHPTSSRRLRHVQAKRRNEKEFESKLRILAEMLRIGPWHRLPLTIQWLKQEYTHLFPINAQPPMHMPIAYGPITVKKTNFKKSLKDNDSCIENSLCNICHKQEEEIKERQKLLKCCNSDCCFICHAICLADKCRNTGFVVPITFTCPKCRTEALWADFVFGNRKINEGLQDAVDDGDGEVIILSETEFHEEEG